MSVVHSLSAGDLDELSSNIMLLHEHSLLLRGLLSLYVTESQYMVDISVNTLANYIWDLTENFCSVLSESLTIVDNVEALCVDDPAEEVY